MSTGQTLDAQVLVFWVLHRYHLARFNCLAVSPAENTPQSLFQHSPCVRHSHCSPETSRSTAPFWRLLKDTFSLQVYVPIKCVRLSCRMCPLRSLPDVPWEYLQDQATCSHIRASPPVSHGLRRKAGTIESCGWDRHNGRRHCSYRF
jgi:hypothetical protein